MGNDLEAIAAVAIIASKMKEPRSRLKKLKQIELLLKSAKAEALIEIKRESK